MHLVKRLRRYTPVDLRGDLAAGATVAVLVVPQAMAYAMLAGLPPVYGLYAAIAPTAVYAWLGSSRHMAVGPVALTSLLVAGGLESLAEPFSAAYIDLAVTLSVLVGGLFVVLGALRAGFAVNFLSHPAILGFNAAAALLTAMSQVRALLGIPREIAQGMTAENPWPIFTHLEHTNAWSLILGLATVAILVAIPRVAPRIPGPLFVCVVGTLATAGFSLDELGVQTVGAVPRGLPSLTIPTLGLERAQNLLPTALSVAAIGYASSITVVKALGARSRERIYPNQELWALGLANVLGAFFRSFPATGGLSRSTVNAQAGARTQMAGLVSAALVLATLLAIAPLFRFLPLPVLAAIIIRSAWRLVEVGASWAILRTHRNDGITLLLTTLATLGLGLAEGLVVGLGAGLMFFIRRTASPHSAELGRIPGTMVYRNVRRFNVETCPQVGILRVDAPLYFANAQYLEDRIHAMFSERPDMRVLALECSSVNDMDATAVASIERVLQTLRGRANDLHIVGAIGPVRDILQRSGLAATIGDSNMHRSILEAAPVWMGAIDRNYCETRCRVAAFPDCTLIPRASLVRPRSPSVRFMPQI